MSDIDLREWVANRDPSYIVRRARSLTTRYGFTSVRARRRVDDCVSALAAQGCAPTFMVPGRVVRAHATYIRSLADRGVELALHGYDHVDFKTLTPSAIVHQFERSADTFVRVGVPFYGFRCPYLSATEEVYRYLPRGLVAYSSNTAVRWPEAGLRDEGNAILRQLEAFYSPQDATSTVVLPFERQQGLIELPCALPDDIQVYDGLGAGEDGLADAWCRILEAIHRRGELQVVVFHPELADRCERALVALLERARSLQPHVWVATLCEVAAWWRERSSCTVRRTTGADGRMVLTLQGSARAVLVAGLTSGRQIAVASKRLPLVGVTKAVSESTRQALRNAGYLLEEAEPERCTVMLDDLPVEPNLIRRLEAHPLVRIARWPGGAGAAMCISGDLDALSLVDYARRF
jgi:polysaccharide deacetylase